jgi:outer membrane protein assembly factor BamB
MGRSSRTVTIVATVASLLTTSAAAQSWPTYRHDNRRSGVTDQSLEFPLVQQWVRPSSQPPQAAWTGPAKWDAWAANSGLQSMRNVDPCFYVTAAAGRVYFGSSIDDAVHCLDANSGAESWVYFTGAPVRFPPTIDNGRAYFGSDDGNVYCCGADSGHLVWSRRAAVGQRRITSNRKIISLWPVRTGVLVSEGKATFAASLVPWEPSWLWSVDAASGDDGGAGCYCQELAGVTLQGAMLASSDRVYTPQGRAAPLAFDRASGKPLGAIGEVGGVFCILTEDEMLLAGPQDQRSGSDQIRIADGESKRRLATFGGANRILVAGNFAWIPMGEQLRMMDRSLYVEAQQEIDRANEELKEKTAQKQPLDEIQETLARATRKQQAAWRWQVECPTPSGFIKAGEAIVLGLVDEVRAYSTADGRLLWQTAVDGTAHGLAVADGRLLVSTGLGHIYAFGAAR